ncbi:hydroxymethylbilane synthase [Demequina oxidasica]|uniref:hydroxymethylbilane synthase n=1 Tax=Demequina oxidasica TaxID=676199 RepID=UPI00078416B5|nr:hydroxymethylbilane synthase [Demequina oxidasica]
MKLRLGTRASTLATTQSGMVADDIVSRAAAQGIDVSVELIEISTKGDRTQGSLVGLSEVGVFVNALRDALLNDECDLIVHSLKDMPVGAHPELNMVAVTEREDVRDALCADGRTLADLPDGARVGTSSPRRAAQVRALRPDLQVADLRGNVDSRLGRVGNDFDAVILAAAGLARLGRSDEVSEFFDVTQMVPAPGQGALGVEIRNDAPEELVNLVGAIDHTQTRAAVTAERATLGILDAGCSAPVAAHATVEGSTLKLNARVTNLAGTLVLNEIDTGESARAESIGKSAGWALMGRGAARLMGRS